MALPSILPKSVWAHAPLPPAPATAIPELMLDQTFFSGLIIPFIFLLGSSGQMLKIELTKHGYLLFDSSAVSQFPGFNVEMTFGSDLPVKETMRKLVVSHIPSSQDSIDMILSSPSIQKIGRAAIQGKIVINSSPSENTSGAGYEP